MIQDIYPSRLYNEFHKYEMSETDNLLIFDKDGKMLAGDNNGEIVFSKGKDAGNDLAIYLFSVDDQRFFLLTENAECTDSVK